MLKMIVRAGVMTAVLAAAPIHSQELGTITFPTNSSMALTR